MQVFMPFRSAFEIFINVAHILSVFSEIPHFLAAIESPPLCLLARCFMHLKFTDICIVTMYLATLLNVIVHSTFLAKYLRFSI